MMPLFVRRLARRATGTLALVSLPLLPLAVAACGAADESALLVGEKSDATLVDRDPVAVLPSGMLVLSYLDASAMFQTRWGGDVAQIVSNLLPLGPESRFVPQRDVVRIYSGVYAMQGADFCSVVQGNFDPDAISKAADARAITISGAPLVKSRYADSDLYTASNIGFVVLTPHTVVAGNETAMRRVLDRLRSGKLERKMHPWMVDLMATKGAAMSLAGDLGADVTAEAAASELPFLSGLRVARVVGNFQAPAMNLAGTFTYADLAHAQAGAAALQHAQQMAGLVGMFTAIGFGAQIPSPQVMQREGELAFTVAIDESFVRLVLRYVGEMSRSAVTSTKAPGAAR
jgi:hypothetical protein